MIFHLEFHVEKPKEFRFSTRLPFRGAWKRKNSRCGKSDEKQHSEVRLVLTSQELR